VRKSKRPPRKRDEARIDRNILANIPFRLGTRGRARQKCSLHPGIVKNELIPDKNANQGVWNMGPKTLKSGVVVEAFASEEITTTDACNLLGMTAMIQNAIDDGTVIRGAEASALKGAPVTIYSIMCSVNSFAEKACGTHDTVSAIESATRLATYVVVYRFPMDGGSAVARYLQSFEFNPETKMVSFSIKETTIERFRTEGWTVSISALRAISGNTAKALWLYLRQQTGTTFGIRFLADLIGVSGEPREQRRRILEALDSLQKTGHVQKFKRVGTNSDLVEIVKPKAKNSAVSG
jgi:hypothetical protein